MIKKGVSGQGLSDLLNKQEGMEFHDGNATVTRFKVSAWVNGKESISPLMARRIELALDLKENSLLGFVRTKGNNMAGYKKVFGKKEGEE